MTTREDAKARPETDETDTEKRAPGPEASDGQPDGDPDALEGTDQPEDGDLESRLEASEKEAKENYDRFLRASADLENYKKRSSRELADFRKYANEGLIRDLLPVVDSLERAIQSTDDTDNTDGFLEGVDLTLKEMLKVFEKHAVKPIDAVGEPFDPTFHQAVMQEASDQQPENTVLKELQRGYTIHDRLLRPTMVVVSKPSTGEEPEKEPDPEKEDS